MSINDTDIAIVGMACRVPGARSAEEFWKNLRGGVESVRALTDEELVGAGVSPTTLADPRYVKSAAVLEEMEFFDAEFFGFSPKEAAIMDPQHRQFLECAWEALENAGHPPETFPGPIGVYGGCGMGAYFIYNLLSNRSLIDSVGLFLLRHTGNDKDFLTTRVSYLLNLTGPSVSVQTACSTSLVAAHLACQSLLSGECDMALAGGVTIEVPHRVGYLYQENEILSPDGHCRAFDHRSKGTIFGSGTGVVVLRRLRDAIEEGDHVWAVIKGTAVNNDGAGKIGYLAPSVDGQAAAIAEALAVAGVSADSIGLIECHGTGTPVGDPIEIAALTQAFKPSTKRTGYCGVGSVKTNIGHLDTAAGVASLIKASMAVHHGELPPSLNFEAPNPTIDFRSSPFFVNHKLQQWSAGGEARRAAINSLGVGGTNAFAIVEQPPARTPSTPSKRPFQLLTLSARNKAALDGNVKRLAAHLREHPELDLADVAYSLHVGRRAFDQRRVLACKNRDEAIALLEGADAKRIFTQKAQSGTPSAVFMFPGGGAQYARMGLDLYNTEPVVRELMDRGFAWLQRKVDFDYRKAMFPGDADVEWAVRELQRPSVQLPLIFLLELALAKLWMSWGVQPDALIGHSLGENTAACLADVFSFEDGLGLVTLRGQLFERVPPGGMISVPLPVAELRPLLGDDLDIATVNSPGFCVASGPAAALDELERKLTVRGVDAKRVPISIAAHSRMVDIVLEDFGAFLRSIKLSPPKIPFISNRTGEIITKELAMSPQYWVDHLRHTVMFADGVATLLKTPGRVFIEAGPGKTLASLARQHPDMKPGQPIIPSLRHPEEKVSDAAYFLTSLGQFWAAGGKIDLKALWKDERRVRVPLPTYAFQRSRYWIEPGKPAASQEETIDLSKRTDLRDWGYRPVWKSRAVELDDATKRHCWLVFLDGAGVGEALVHRLRKRGHEVITVREGDGYFKAGADDYFLSPEHGREGYASLIRDLVGLGKVPDRVAHLWLLTADESFRPGSSFFHRNQERGFYSLFFLAQAMGEEGIAGPRHFSVIANGMQKVADEALPYPEKATVVGPCKVIPREFPGYSCGCVDVALPDSAAHKSRWGKNGSTKVDVAVIDAMERELLAPPASEMVAHRGGQRYRQEFERTPLEPIESGWSKKVREQGVYVITGGLGGIGGALAEALAKQAKAKLVLVGRSELPPREQWSGWVSRKGSDDATSRRIKRIQELETLGAEVLPVAADVTDVEAMGEMFDAVKLRFGAVHGVIHAAGVLHDGLIQVKNQAEIEEVFAPKIHGTLVLDALTKEMDLDFFVVFSSTSTVTAPAGQVDYVAANEFLNAYARSRSNTGRTKTIALNWGVWSGVGMAAETAARMEKGSTPAAQEHPTTHPLFVSRSTDSRGVVTLTAKLSTKTHWILDEHRTRTGHAVMPGTGYLEIARAALAECGEQGSFEIADLYFFRALAVGDDEVKEARVRLHPNDSGYTMDVQSKATLEDGRSGWENHAQCRLLLRALPAAKSVSPSAIRERCNKRSAQDIHGIRSKQEQHILFGSRWRVLREAHFGAGECIGRLEIPADFAQDLNAYGLHPALMDFATGFALDSTAAYGAESETLWVPLSYRAARIHAPFTTRLWSWVRVHGEDKPGADFVAFDVVITDENGRVLVEVDEFSMKRLPADLDFGAALKPSAADLEFEGAGAVSVGNLSPAELAFRRLLAGGILPPEGVEAFARVLGGASPPQIVVSSMDLHALLRQTEEAAKETKSSDAKFDRPALDSEYVEPRDDVEKTLVGFWEELLGVDKVGVRDSFFDLGGHSLIAVRLFAKIKKTYQVEYPISVLFNAPTIEACAALIHEAIGKGEGKAASAAVVSSKPRYRHLVPMHIGDKGDKTPYFLVAGMFGNVLNLRHLAHLIGHDRPFYGVQARGLYGDDQPHENFEEMAVDYLAEIRMVQPHGPYMLGGFSGGGLAAWEMTRQLRDAGEEVSLLVLLDTPLPTQPPLSKTDKLQIHWQSLRRQGPSYVTDWAKRRLERKHETEGDNGHARELSPAEFRSEAIKDAFYRALPKYNPPHLDGAVMLFRPKLDPAYHLADGRLLSRSKDIIYPDNGWAPFCGRVEVHEVPGDHDSMVLEPNVRTLAQKLRKCIAAAQARRPALAGV